MNNGIQVNCGMRISCGGEGDEGAGTHICSSPLAAPHLSLVGCFPVGDLGYLPQDTYQQSILFYSALHGISTIKTLLRGNIASIVENIAVLF